MHRVTKSALFLLGLLCAAWLYGPVAPWAVPVSAAAEGPHLLWHDLDEGALSRAGQRPIVPDRYRLLGLQREELLALLATAPLERTAAAAAGGIVLSLPLPDGTYGRFRMVESPIMQPELAARFPQIRTYAGQGLDDPTASVRADWTPNGFHALILAASGTVYIDPYRPGETGRYISYDTRDYRPLRPARLPEPPPTGADRAMAQEIATLIAASPPAAVGSTLRTYRLAVAATGEYTQYHGGTVTAGLAAIVTTINRVTAIYEREVAVRLILVDNNHLLVYTNPATDPYSNSNPTALLNQNQANIDAVIGDANYDVGHVFSTGGGGLAGLGVVCRTGQKARGETGSAVPVGDPFDVDYVAHELGHQFGANHTFNGTAGACISSNRNGPTAYEPGSGSTIMAYAGICGAQDLQAHSDAYFHAASFDEIVAFTTVGAGSSCPQTTATGNSAPLVSAGPGGYTIPAQTPFTLTGSATDNEGDALTYSWEEMDLGAAGAPNNPLQPPFFRSFTSSSTPSRTFPRWSDLVANSSTIGEVLPNVTRSLSFRLTVRDNRSGGGGVAHATTTLAVTTAAGPFRVTTPNSAVSWSAGITQTVTWDVADTHLAPVHCAAVDIRLSSDGGFTYPLTLVAGVANSGSADVLIPNLESSRARVQVACADHLFFDISDVDFTVIPSSPAQAVVTPVSLASTQAADMGVTRTLILSNTGGLDLVWTLLGESETWAQPVQSISPERSQGGRPLLTPTGAAAPWQREVVVAPATAVSLAASALAAGGLTQGFETVSSLPGWASRNNSDLPGTTGWFQGDPTVFAAQSGASNSYVAANFNNTGGSQISNWLMTPLLELQNGETFTFWTRARTSSTYPDRLQVRLSQAGFSTDVGSEPSSVGDFDTLLLDINPTLSVGGYPTSWTRYELVLSGLPAQGVQGRMAFRYYVQNGGPTGANSEYIGIDTVSYTGALGPCALSQNIPWLAAAPNSGHTAPASATQLAVSFDSTGLALGTYAEILCVESNDPQSPRLAVPVSLTVASCAAAAAPTGVTIARQGADIQLGWTDQAANVGGYAVHRGSTPYFVPSPATLLAELPAGATAYTDPGGAGAEGSTFYAVQGINGCSQQSALAAWVGQVQMPLVPGN